MHVTRQPVQLRNHQHCFVLAAGCEGCGNFRAIIAFPAFHLGEGSDQLTTSLQESMHGLMLCFQSQARPALPVSRYAVICYVRACFHASYIAHLRRNISLAVACRQIRCNISKVFRILIVANNLEGFES